MRIWDVATGSQLLAVTVDAGKWTTAKFSPDCQRFLATSEKKLAVFEAITGRQLLDLTGEDNSFLRMNPTFSPDGRLIALNRTNGTVILRDAFTGVELKSLRGHTDQITAAEFSSDGHRFLTLSQDKSARIWNVTTGEPILVVSSRKNFSEIAIFSPDGSKVFIAEDEGSKLFDAITGIELVSFDATIVHGSQARFSPDGTKIALIDGDRNPRILDAQTGKILHTLNGGGEWYSGVEFNREGSRIVTASDHYASVWDVTTGEWLWDLPGPEKRTDTALFTPDGTRILTASGNEVRFWDAATRLPSIKLGNTAFIRDLGTNRGTPTPKWGILTVIMHPPLTIDHRKFGNLEIWLPTGTTYFCRDGSRAVTHTWSQERPSKAGFSIWDVGELRLLANIPERDGYTRNVDIHPDGSRVLTSGTNGLVIWEAATGRELFTIPHPRSEVIGAEFTPDGSKIAITVADSVIEIIDATNGTPLKQFRGIVDSGSHFNGISCIAFNAAGDRMAAGQLNGVTCIWDLATQARLMELKGHGGEIKTVAFHPDGSRIATVAADGAIRIWDLGSGQELLALRTDSEEEFAVFSPDGTSLISSRIWDTVPYRQRYTQMMRSPASRPSTTAPTSN